MYRVVLLSQNPKFPNTPCSGTERETYDECDRIAHLLNKETRGQIFRHGVEKIATEGRRIA